MLFTKKIDWSRLKIRTSTRCSSCNSNDANYNPPYIFYYNGYHSNYFVLLQLFSPNYCYYNCNNPCKTAIRTNVWPVIVEYWLCRMTIWNCKNLRNRSYINSPKSVFLRWYINKQKCWPVSPRWTRCKWNLAWYKSEDNRGSAEFKSFGSIPWTVINQSLRSERGAY